MSGLWEERYSLKPDYSITPSAEEWFDGRDMYAFLVEIDSSEIVSDSEEVLQELSEFNCLRVLDSDSLHITLKQIGFVVDRPDENNEVSEYSASMLADKAEQVFDEVDPFTVRLGKLNLFSSVVYCEIEHSTRLEDIHHRLLSFPETKQFEYDGYKFAPHMTLAEFRSDSDYLELLEYLEENRDSINGELEVTSVSLAKTTSYETMPDFEIVRRFDL